MNEEQKPVTVIGIDPGFKNGDKSMIVTVEVTEDGLKVTNFEDAREAFQRLKGTIGETPIHPGIEGKPPINPELLKPAEQPTPSRMLGNLIRLFAYRVRMKDSIRTQ